MAPPPFPTDAASTALPDGDKAALRRELRARRRRLAQAREAASRALAEQLDALPVIDWEGRTVSLYLADATEIDPAPLARRMVERGARIALPVVTARDTPLAFRLTVTEDRLVPDGAGIPAPPPASPAVRPDVVLAPLLGFDAQGGRIGQGGGYYDRTLAVLRAEGPVIVIGLAYAGQLCPHLPMDTNDQRLDGVLTEEGYRAASPL